MAIRVQGTIVISRKSGKRGAFNVGELRTEIGEFEVKDALIEEYEEGSYTGSFFINWIEPESFSWRGRVFVKNRAQLDAIQIDDADTATPPAPQQPPVPDPVDEHEALVPGRDAKPSSELPVLSGSADSSPPTPQAPSAPGASPAATPQRPTAQAIGQAPATGHEAGDLALFGEELQQQLALQASIKLDPTVDRITFRAQRDRLKQLGYSFDAKSQTWAVATAS